MWKELKQIWFSDNLLSEAWDMTYEALNIDSEMFNDATDALWGDNRKATQKLIFKKDKLVNKYEREIRRKVITHLSVKQGEGLSAGLVLSTVIVDVERIGDYIKNIVDLTEMHPGELSNKKMKSILNNLEKTIKKTFSKVQVCIENGDEDEALDIYLETKEIGRTCDDNIRLLVTGDKDKIFDSSTVVYALYLRYLKRINAHLRNIISSVINPYDRIGFKPKKNKVE